MGVADDLLKYNEYTPQVQGLDRQRKMAEMLMTQGLQPQQGQMISGRYVAPSWTQQLAGLANIAAGTYMQEQADAKQQELANALRGERTASLQKFASAETPQQKIALAASDPNLQQFLPELMKNVSVKKDEVIYGPNGKVLFEGKPDLPSNVQEAIIYKNLPPNPKDWTPEQRALAEMTNLTHRKAGASNFNPIINTGKSLSEQVGDIVKESRANAISANNTITSANKIIEALGKPNVTGFGANAQLTGLQLATALGVGGAKTEDRLANTRQVLQETAKLALAAPPKGQGAVSNYERELFTRASSGEGTFTPTELRIIANRAVEGANYTKQIHRQQMDVLKSNPQYAPLVPFYDIPEPNQAGAVVGRRPAQ